MNRRMWSEKVTNESIKLIHIPGQGMIKEKLVFILEQLLIYPVWGNPYGFFCLVPEEFNKHYRRG